LAAGEFHAAFADMGVEPGAAIPVFQGLDEVERLGLAGALSAQRSNGLYSMVERIRRDAQQALAAGEKES